MSSLGVEMPSHGVEVNDQSPLEDEPASSFELPMHDYVIPHAIGSPMQEERENVDVNYDKAGEGFSRKMEGIQEGNSCKGGGSDTFCFKFGSRDKFKKAHRRAGLGSIFRKAHTSSSKEVSPVESRPKKRTRPSEEEPAPGFGFVGFTSRAPVGNESITRSRMKLMGD
ncbi:hypothetical protein Hanom_Chr11g00967501 [Helianthus anomalus]